MSGLLFPIQTPRLLLRPHRWEDIEPLLAYYADPVVARYIPWEPWSRHDAEEQVRKRVSRTGIVDASSILGLVVEREGRVIGDVLLWPADETLSRGEVGWAFHPEFAGKGFATEATQALFDVAFEHYGMHRLVAHVDARNVASARLCERLGMTKEAHLRKDQWAKGEWTDTVIYGLLAEEWSHRFDPGAESRRCGPTLQSGG
ncbi:MAG TPA: GNAT family N-acetyltransferase [Nocardioidaceae bacterium]|nr:GNAT family N-acetyltransferase [Nocardioidaceae bacterium]